MATQWNKHRLEAALTSAGWPGIGSLPSHRHEIQMLQPALQRLGAGLAIGLAPEEATDLGHHADGFAQSRRSFGRHGTLRAVGNQGLLSILFSLFEIDIARHFGHFAPEVELRRVDP